MRTTLLTMPDDPAAVPPWLERQLLGPDLDRLAAELAVTHRPQATPILDDVLGPHAPAVLARGLAALPRPALSVLLRNPALLTELRDLVLVEGGPYWDRYTADLAAAAARVAERVRAAVGRAEPPTPRPPRRGGTWLGSVVTMLATAAAVLVAVYLAGGLRFPAGPPGPAADGPETAAAPKPAGWGFQRVEQLPRDAADADTLRALAGLAAEWRKKTPETAPALAKRLVEFREGCAAIQLSADLPLSETQRRWLKGRCADWAAEVDGHLRALEETRDVAAVRAAADRTADRVAAELRARADRA